MCLTLKMEWLNIELCAYLCKFQCQFLSTHLYPPPVQGTDSERGFATWSASKVGLSIPSIPINVFS
jgi:hypothetical protein